MKKLAWIAAILAALCLTACSDGGVPYGMQTVADGSDGYLFYAPDTMQVYTGNGFATAYISDVDHTGMVLSYTDLAADDTRSVNDFYNEGLSELQALPSFTLVKKDATLMVSGISSPYAIYTFRNGETVYKSQVIYTLAGDRCYVFNFTVTEESFSSYDKALTSTIGYITYTDTRKEETPFTGYEDPATPEGMMRVSNPEIADYRFYAPIGYQVVDNGDNTLVYVSKEDKTSFSVYPTIPDATTFSEYLTAYKADLEDIYQNLHIYTERESVPFGGRENAYLIEYTGLYRGEKYCVRQYFISPPSGYYIYIFTYTARDTVDAEGDYYFEKHLADMEKMASAFRFEGEE